MGEVGIVEVNPQHKCLFFNYRQIIQQVKFAAAGRTGNNFSLNGKCAFRARDYYGRICGQVKTKSGEIEMV
jgi:hypothetical protein